MAKTGPTGRGLKHSINGAAAVRPRRQLLDKRHMIIVAAPTCRDSTAALRSAPRSLASKRSLWFSRARLPTADLARRSTDLDGRLAPLVFFYSSGALRRLPPRRLDLLIMLVGKRPG